MGYVDYVESAILESGLEETGELSGGYYGKIIR